MLISLLKNKEEEKQRGIKNKRMWTTPQQKFTKNQCGKVAQLIHTDIHKNLGVFHL